MKIKQQYGLIGKSLKHSFSKSYFSEKFLREGRPDCHYDLFELKSIEDLPELLGQYDNLRGLNVTIPYKEAVLPYMDKLSSGAATIGAVNTISIIDGKRIGYNTDVIGFSDSLQSFLTKKQDVDRPSDLRALILGTGGASKAVAFVLSQLAIPYQFVSRKPTKHHLIYQDVNDKVLAEYKLIVNTTPLGTYPSTEEKPILPYQALTPQHYLYDLVYNPPLTAFLKEGTDRGASTINGLPMLIGQAEAAWKIWQGEPAF